MNRLLHLAALIALPSPAMAHAQITDPNNLIAPPPPPLQFRGKHLIRPTDLQWLWQYTQPAPVGNESGLLSDPHFGPMLDDNLKGPQAFFRNGALPLPVVVQQYFSNTTGGVHTSGNRYISLAGCAQPECNTHGLLWIDTAVQRPTVVFAATEWTTEGKPVIDPDATFNLWLFSSRTLDPADLPPALLATLSTWNTKQHIQTALLIDPNGTPHKLNPTLLRPTPATSATPAIH
jgi:hypothetical protein